MELLTTAKAKFVMIEILAAMMDARVYAKYSLAGTVNITPGLRDPFVLSSVETASWKNILMKTATTEISIMAMGVMGYARPKRDSTAQISKDSFRFAEKQPPLPQTKLFVATVKKNKEKNVMITIRIITTAVIVIV